jgi:hypothetical protein
MYRIIAAAIFLTAAPAIAFANSCPLLMNEIDAAIESASLSEADMTRVEELRARGEELHEAGDHEGSMTALEEAKQILGI